MGKVYCACAAALAASLCVTGCSAHDVEMQRSPSLTEPPRVTTPPPAPGETARSLDPSVYRVPIDGLPAIGDESALVTVVMFSDYQCPFCARLESALDGVRTQYGDDVRIVIAPRPLPMHPNARPAARAALAAAAQGKFEAMHRRLVALGKDVDDASIERAAAASGLDMTMFEGDRNSAAIEKALASADELATRFSVLGTPTTFVNGRRVTGAQVDIVRRLVGEQLEVARAAVARGVERRKVYATLTEKGLDRAGRDPSMMMLPKFVHDRAMRAHSMDLVACAPLEGPARSTLSLVIRTDGTVAKAEATPSSAHADCVASRAKSWTFPPTNVESKIDLVVGRDQGAAPEPAPQK